MGFISILHHHLENMFVFSQPPYISKSKLDAMYRCHQQKMPTIKSVGCDVDPYSLKLFCFHDLIPKHSFLYLIPDPWDWYLYVNS